MLGHAFIADGCVALSCVGHHVKWCSDILRFPATARLSLSSLCVGLAVATAMLEVGPKDGESRALARQTEAGTAVDGWMDYVT